MGCGVGKQCRCGVSTWVARRVVTSGGPAEALPDGHQDWQDDWRKAMAVEVMNSRAEAFEKAIETALKIEAGR